MKLVFSRPEEGSSVQMQIVEGTATIDFSYVEMVKGLLNENEFEESVYNGQFSDEEKEKINQMLARISRAVTEQQQEDDSDE